MHDSSNPPVPPAERSTPPRKRRRWLRVLVVAAALVILLVALLPYGIGTSFGRTRLRDAIADNVRGDVELAGACWSWTSGVTVEGLVIGNPPGFPDERPALRLRRATADVGIAALLFGSPRFTADVQGLEAFVEQNADGQTNLQQLARTASQPQDPADTPTDPPQSPGDGGPTRGDASAIAFDVRLSDALVEVRREGKLLEAMSGLTFHARSEAGSADIEVDGATQLLAGDVSLDVDVHGDSGETTARLISHGLDLASWQPLVTSLLPDQVTALAGTVDGELLAIVRGDQQVELGGELLVEAPRIAGAIVGDMDLRSPRWRIAPALSLGSGADKSVDASGFAIDLGWLHVNGRPSDNATEARLAYDVDVAALAEFGGPIPAMLKGSGSQLTGELRLPTAQLPADAAGWAKALTLEADLRVARLEIAGFGLQGVEAGASLADGAFALSTSESTLLDGGPLVANVQVDLGDLDSLTTSARLSWRGGQLTGGATSALRYVVPLLSGLDPQVAQLVGSCDVELQLSGPAAKPDGTTWLQWMNTWSGSGSLGMSNAAFAPSGQLQGLLAPLGPLTKGAVALGDNGRLEIDTFSAPFRFAEGFVHATASEWLAKGRKIGLSGKVSLAGDVDYAIDLADALRGHRDGERVLQALGGKLPAAKLTGTVDQPALALPELGDVASKLLEQQGRDLLQKGLQELFKK